MYQKQRSQNASPSGRSKPKSQDIAPTGTYGSLSSVVQRAQQDPNSINRDERQHLESAIGTRSMREILAGKKTPWVPEFRGISAQLWREAGQVGAPIQAKLTIGAVGDRYEQAAERVAKEVVQRINTPQTNAVQKQDAAQMQPDTLQRQETEEDEQLQLKRESREIQRKQLPEMLKCREAIAEGEASTDLESAINSAKGSGQPLDASLQWSMGQAMGTDFSRVRVHTDAQSDRLNRSIQAKAFTTGQDVFFRSGEYNPGSRGGQELIAHELTHVVQQNGGAVMLQRSHYTSGDPVYMDDNDPTSKLLDDNFDEIIKPNLNQPTADGIVEEAVNNGTTNNGTHIDVVLWRSTTGESVTAITAAESAGGATAQENVAAPGYQVQQEQIAVGGVTPEYTASSNVTGFSWRHWLVVVRINTRYLARGSSPESGWICSPAAPVVVLDTVDRTMGLPEPSEFGAA